jgi:Phage tail tube protein, GTA-gp10
MSAPGTRSIIWSHGEDQFCLSKVGLILDLEEKCKAGLASILTRLTNSQWHLNDVRETIRLGLIGGGMAPDKAMAAVRNHVDENPNGLGPSVMVAYSILEAVIVGVKDDPVGKAGAEAENLESTETTADSADQK